MFIKAEPNFADGFEGQVALRLVFSGCRKGAAGTPCQGCHNPELWQFKDEGLSVPEGEFVRTLEYWKNHDIRFDCISLVGGEPLDQRPEELLHTMDLVRAVFGDIPVITYTGYTEEEVKAQKLDGHPGITEASYVKFGPYIEGLGPKGKLASSNQRMTKAVKSPEGIRTFTEIEF